MAKKQSGEEDSTKKSFMQQRFQKVEHPEDSAKRFTLDAFMKSYKALEKKFHKGIPADKFDISIQVIKKVFNIKHYDVVGESIPGELPQIDELCQVFEKHLDYILLEYIWVNR